MGAPLSLYSGPFYAGQNVAISADGGISVNAGSVVTSATLDTLFNNPLQGSVVFRGAALWATLPPGTAGYVLTSAGPNANPSWATPISSAALDLLFGGAPSQGSIIYRNATTWVALGPGSAGQVLESGGAGANPAWGTLSPAPADVAKTANYNAVSSDGAWVNRFTNTGAAGAVAISLPALAASQVWRAVVTAAQTFGFTAPAGKTIRYGNVVSAAGGTITSNSIGAAVQIEVVNGNLIVTGAVGPWTVT